jgi:hypothetical protein
VARCLLITQCTPVLEHEPQFVPQVCPYGWTVLKSRLKWSTTWWRGAGFYPRRSLDCWILAGGIDRFSIAYSSGFIVQISVRANPHDRVVINEVPIGGHVGPSIRFFVATFSHGHLICGRRVLESSAQDCHRAPLFLLLSQVLKIIVVRCSSYSDHRRVTLWMTMFRTTIAYPSGTSHRISTMPWVHKDESQRFPHTWCVSIDIQSLDIWSRITGNTSRWDQSHVNTRHEILYWFRPLRGVIALRPVLMYYAIKIGFSLFLLGSFGDFFRGSSGCLPDVFNVDLSSLFIVREPPHRV